MRARSSSRSDSSQWRGSSPPRSSSRSDLSPSRSSPRRSSQSLVPLPKGSVYELQLHRWGTPEPIMIIRPTSYSSLVRAVDALSTLIVQEKYQRDEAEWALFELAETGGYDFQKDNWHLSLELKKAPSRK